jgi:hypothetical protein
MDRRFQRDIKKIHKWPKSKGNPPALPEDSKSLTVPGMWVSGKIDGVCNMMQVVA